MGKINNILIIILTIISYLIGLYALKYETLVRVLISLMILPTMLVPKILKKLNFKITNNIEFIYIVFIFFAYFLGTVVNLYDKISCYDTIMHFISGIFETFLGFYILKNLNGYNKKKLILNTLFVLGFVSLASTGWEVFEFVSSIIFKVDPQKVITTGVTDTMKDIIVALIGSLIVLTQYVLNNNNDKEVINIFLERN